MKVLKNEKLVLDEYKTVFENSSIHHNGTFEIKKESYEEGRVFIKNDDFIFRIASTKELRSEFEEYLESSDIPEIPLKIWVDAVGDIHTEKVFVENFISKLGDKEEFEALNIAINLSNHASKSPKVFWGILYDIIFEYKLYFKAVDAAIEIQNKEALLDIITDLMIDEGENYLNERKDGIYISTKFNNKMFHIYNVDSANWEF